MISSLAASILVLLTLNLAHAQVVPPITTQSFQLQQLITKSEAQLKAIREILKVSGQDQKSLESASHSLEKLSAGLEKSIEQFQGTAAYQDALLRLQAEDRNPKSKLKPGERFESFQSQTVNANLADLDRSKKIETALRTAEPGFREKLAAETELGNWQTSVRISAQLTDLLGEIHKLTQDLEGKNQGGLSSLVLGSEMQNQRQREVMANGPR